MEENYSTRHLYAEKEVGLRFIARTTGHLLLFESLLLAASSCVSLAYGGSDLMAFGGALAMSLTAGILLSACGRRKVAATDVSVLINGETGTGKEVFARAIHSASRRSAEPFLALNCSAFSRELLESELFGYKAGAFTGAVRDKRGLLEEAHHGTLCLDEVGEMALELQSKLLRVLETGEFVKVGDTKTTRVDVRILSATNRHLKEEITNGRFREGYLLTAIIH